MKVLMVAPEKAAYETEIGNSLADMQKVVGGMIQAVYPYDEPVALVCNEEGKLERLPLNRALRDEAGDVYDIIAGNFFVCGIDEDNFDSLSSEYMEKFKTEFQDPEVFMRINGKIWAVKVTEQDMQNSNRSSERKDPER